MSQITNRLGLPEAFVNAVKNDSYSPGSSDFTVTELIGPPRIGALKRKHRDEITEDASDRVWNLIGQVSHGILERSNTVDLVEKRFYTEILGSKIGGQFDSLILETATLSDYKVTTVWKFKADESGYLKVPDEYTAQLNILAYILAKNGIKVNALKTVAILRDWSKPEARRNKDYPQTNVLNLDVPYWEEDDTRKYLEERVALHQSAQKLLASGIEPPICTPEERWLKPTKYATKKKDAKRATKLYDTYDEASRNCGPGMIVETRPGEDTRCLLYCPVAFACSHGKLLLNENSMEGIF